jgi:hypothetical protein
MIALIITLSLVTLMVVIVLVLGANPEPPKLMTKKDHEAQKVAEELGALREMNAHYKRHT